MGLMDESTAAAQEAAWRIAVEHWLTERRYISVFCHPEVLPCFSSVLAHD